MPVFSHLDLEGEVQLKDKTRFDASKCFGTQDLPDFTELLIKPGADVSPISVFVADKQRDWVLDWQFESWTIDVDSTNDRFAFMRAGVEYVAILTQNTYSISGLIAEIQTQMLAVDSNGYTVTADQDDKITIAGTAGFDLLIRTGSVHTKTLLNELYFGIEDLTGKVSYLSGRVESLKKKITAQAGQDLAEIQTIKAVADVLGSLNNKYFFIYSALNAIKYYVWFNVSSSGTDPMISGATGVEIVISTGASANTVASAIRAALDALGDFAATVSTDTVTVTNSNPGYSTPAYELSGPGLTYAVVQTGELSDSKSFYIQVFSDLGDSLYSSDQDIMSHESDILKWVKAGRATFKNMHRKAQKLILNWLDKEGWTDQSQKKFTKWALVDHSEVNVWATYLALRLIFESNAKQSDDIESEKAKRYKGLEVEARNRFILRIDIDGDGKLDLTETIGVSFATVVRR